MSNRLAIAQAYYDSLSWAYDEAVKEQQRLHGMLLDAKERCLRLRIDKNNAWGELEMERAALAADKRQSADTAGNGDA